MILMSKEKKSQGAPKTDYDEAELYAIVGDYRDNVKPIGMLSYAEIHRHNQKLFEEKSDICKKNYSVDFWKRVGQPGRKVVDEANDIRKTTLVDANNNKKDIPNVTDVVNKYIKDPERLIKHLLPLESEVRRSIATERKLKEKNTKLINEIENLKKEKRELKELKKSYENLIYQLFYYSDKDGTPLENLLDINNKNRRIKGALEEAFKPGHIQDFYFEVSNYKEKSTEHSELENSKNSNLISLSDEKFKKGRSIMDDFDGLF